MLDEDSELDATFSNIAGAGIKVVRAWAFNDVSAKPAAGVYFQVRFLYHSAELCLIMI
jgi:mannan endo-1,4-beta-mannosidase